MTSETSEYLSRRIRALQAVAAALIGGVVAFAGVVVVLQSIGAAPLRPNADPPIVSITAAGLFVLLTPLSFFVPRRIANQQYAALHSALLCSGAATDKTNVLFDRFQGMSIVGLAMLEGSAMFSLIAILVEGQIWTAGLVAAAIALMLVRIPTLDKAQSWMDERLRDAN